MKLNDIVKPISSQLKLSKVNSIGKYVVYGASGKCGYIDSFKVDKNYVALVKDGAGVGHVYKLNATDSFLGTMQGLVPNDNIDRDYVYYLIRYLDLGAKFNGATIPHIYFKNYGKETIKNIDYQKQVLISKELSKIEDEIFNKKKQFLFLDELVKSRFIEMFGDCKTKKPLEELTTKITDGSHNPPKGIEKSEFLMLSSQNVHNELDLTDVRYLTKEDFEVENKRTDVQKGDVLLTIVGTIGRTHVVKENEKYTFQRSVGVIKPKNNILNGTFLSVYLHTEEAIDQLESGGHGSSQKGIYLKDIKKLLIPIPKYRMQLEFESFVELIDKSKFIVQQEIKDLQELLDKKMDEYFGQ